MYEHVGWVQWNLQLIIFLFKLSLPCNWSASCESTLMLFLNWFSFSICSVPKMTQGKWSSVSFCRWLGGFRSRVRGTH